LADVSVDGAQDKNLARDAALLRDTVREAGVLALSLFRTELKNWIKGASSPVSEADIRVNDLLESRLRSATPDYGWLSEESADDEERLRKQLVWIVDPIDGTRGYLAGREDWCVSVALVDNASPVLAAVFVPASDEFFFAARGQGRRAQRCAGFCDTRHRAGFFPRGRAETAGRTARQVLGRNHPSSQDRIAGASAVPGRAGKARCGLCRRPKSRLGPCRGQFDRAGSEW
jgi:fructose-1,6-bisphosphatase/inositol monophosphatase family enzyme